MIPEQIWDAADIPDRFLFNGHPAGSGMPLVWAHSEYIKLLRSLHNGSVWDMPTQTVKRYLWDKQSATFQIWTAKQRRAWLANGMNLRIDLEEPADIEWSLDGRTHKQPTLDSGFHLYTAMLPLHSAPSGAEITVKIHPRSQQETRSFKLHIRQKP